MKLDAQPLSTLGKLCTSVQLDDQAVEAEFVVISGTGRPLLGRKTAVQLGVLKLGPQVNSVDTALRVKFKEGGNTYQSTSSLYICYRRKLFES